MPWHLIQNLLSKFYYHKSNRVMKVSLVLAPASVVPSGKSSPWSNICLYLLPSFLEPPNPSAQAEIEKKTNKLIITMNLNSIPLRNRKLREILSFLSEEKEDYCDKIQVSFTQCK